MKKALKILLIAVLLILVVLIVLSQITISTPGLKKVAINQAEKYLPGEISLGELRVNLVRGIFVNNVVLSNPPGFTQDTLLTVKELVIRYHLLPLLQRKLVIGSIKIEEPTLLLERNEEGDWNFSRFAPTKEPAAKKEQEKEGGFRFSLLVSRFNLIQGKLTLIDNAPPGQRKPISLQDINLSIAGLSPLTPANLQMSFVTSSDTVSRLDLSGKIENWKNPRFDLNIQGEIAFEKIMSALTSVARERLAGLEISDVIRCVANLTGSREEFILGMDLDLQENDIRYKNIFHKPTGMFHKVSLKFRQVEEEVKIDSLLLQLGETAWQVKGSIDKNAQAKLQLNTTRGKISELGNLIVPLSALVLSGNMEMEASLQGTLEQPDIQGKIQLSSGAIAHQKQKLSLEGINLALNLGMKAKKGEKPIQLTGSGKVEVARGEAGPIKFTAMSIPIDLKGQSLSLKKITAQLLEGQFQADLSMDLPPAGKYYQLTGELNNANLSALTISPHYTLEGELDTKFSVEGEIGDQGSISGKSSIEISKLEMRGMPIWSIIANSLGMPELDRLSFRKTTGDFVIKNSSVNIRQLELTSSRLIISAQGNVGFDQQLDCQLAMKFSPELASQIKIKEVRKIFTQEGDREVLYCYLGGTLNRPRVDFLRPKLERVIEEKLEEKLKEIFQ